MKVVTWVLIKLKDSFNNIYIGVTLLEASTIIWIISMGIVAGTPLLFAALGELLAERSGVLNLGIEGFMLLGAMAGFMATFYTGNKWFGLLAVMAICALLGIVIAFLLVTLRANQIATGISFTIFCTGLTTIIGKPMLGQLAADSFDKIEMPFLSGLPLLKLIMEKDLMVYLAVLLCIAVFIFIKYTKAGLYLKAAGVNPGALDSMGVNVFRIRYLYVIVSSMLAGLGGAYLTLAYTQTWVEGMSAGRGWLAIALVNFALWKPVRAIFGAYLFGFFYAFSFRLEAIGIAVPSNFIKMLPYLLPILVLILLNFNKKSEGAVAPLALGLPYSREEK